MTDEEGRRILIIEDSPTQAAKLADLLESESFSVSGFQSAEEALRGIGENPPDLLIVDFYLPGMRGDEFCRRIRLNREARRIPILMFTADETQAMELRGLDAGADDYIAKSADSRVLLARVRTLMRKGLESLDALGPAHPRLREVRMLAVDDSPTYLGKIVAELEREGYRVDGAGSGAECLDKLKIRPYDCVLVDLVMPDLDGIEVCRRVAAMRRGLPRPVGVLVLTARENKDDLTRALEAGADDFVGKSSDLAVLKGRIRALLRRNFMLDENRKILSELKAKEFEAARARIEKEAVAARAALAAQLEAANRELESFSYSVSHDLRAPLRAIDGFSKILLEDHAANLGETGREHLGRIREGCLRMGRLIEDLLGLAKVVRKTLSVEPADLSAIAREVVAGLEKAEPGRRVVFSAPPTLPVSGDPGLLRAALENLLGNAWKFTGKRAGAEIVLGVSEAGGERVFSVKDNGAGFDMAYAGKLFGAFQRLHSQSEFAGTGIGLATVERIVKRHGGRIWAEGAVGRGAAFHFTLETPPER